jgi:hypothetical protein
MFWVGLGHMQPEMKQVLLLFALRGQSGLVAVMQLNGCLCYLAEEYE